MANAFKGLAPGTIDVLAAIARRAQSEMAADPVQTLCFLAEVHQDRPLRLIELEDADDFNFSHDVAGILRHWDHDTRTMRDCFVPRFTA